MRTPPSRKDRTVSDDDIITITAKRGEIRDLVSDSWHDSATASGERFVQAAFARGAAAVTNEQPRYLVGQWEHLFDEGDRDRNRLCDIVFDTTLNKVIHMSVQRDQKMRPSTQIERDDLTDSLVNANPEAIDNPEEWDLQRTSLLPDWAIEA